MYQSSLEILKMAYAGCWMDGHSRECDILMLFVRKWRFLESGKVFGRCVDKESR